MQRAVWLMMALMVVSCGGGKPKESPPDDSDFKRVAGDAIDLELPAGGLQKDPLILTATPAVEVHLDLCALHPFFTLRMVDRYETLTIGPDRIQLNLCKVVTYGCSGKSTLSVVKDEVKPCP